MMKTGKNRLKLALAACMVSTVLLGACTDETITNDQVNVTMKAELEGGAALNKMVALSGAEADSLKISRVRILISELKLHRDKEDTIAGDKSVKTGPMLITIDSTGTRTFSTGTIPAGSYDKLKFEFHRFSQSEVAGYLSDTTFADFVTNDRYTFIFDGTVYTNGQAFPFSYHSDATANLQLKFDPALALTGGSSVVIVVQVNPSVMLKDSGKILDPRDGSNESKIDNAIKSAIKALKR
jgi:hypothetical protein